MTAIRWVGKAGEVAEVPAMVCVWCERPHFITAEDRLRRAAGAPVSHGICAAASERIMADVEALGNGTA